MTPFSWTPFSCTLFWQGQNLLAQAEQTEVLQPVIDIDGPAFWKNVTASAFFPGSGAIMGTGSGTGFVLGALAIGSPVPGDSTTFQAWAPGASFGTAWSRYNFFAYHIVGKWQAWRKIHTGKLNLQTVYAGGYN